MTFKNEIYCFVFYYKKINHLRTDSLGIDLNRQWHSTNKDQAVEVYSVINAMKEIGVDFLLDVHGDENIPYVFLVDRQEDPNYNARICKLENIFKEEYKKANSDFQCEHGYPRQKHTSEKLLSIASHAIGERFDCLSLTIEMPFKDNADHPDEYQGWSHIRSMNLGKDLLYPLAALADKLR